MTIELSCHDRQRIVDLYEGRLREFGHDVRTVGWGSRRDQWLRFAVLSRGLSLAGKRILDLGCGLGDLVAYLDAQRIVPREYVGLDISAALIAQANKLYGGPGRRFIVGDILQVKLEESFDVIVSSGALSFKVSDNEALAKSVLARTFSDCREAVCVNFLSTYVDYQLPKNFHYQPEAMFSYARTLTPWVSLIHDYPLYEFTLQLFRQPRSQ